ncbi:N-methyl-L-tryptophan oxidase [bacterium]|nr:N-methyl-L-tryptophan oxidase [bacterium]
MVAKIFDTIVIGAGAMGSAAAWRLAAGGQKVLVLDRFKPPHGFGSTHGETRVIREAYFEHPAYVPLVQRAYELWRELEEQSGRRLLQTTGGLMIGRPDGVVFSGAKRSAEEHRLPFEILEAAEVTRRFPALHVPTEMKAVFEPRAGILFVEHCVTACLDRASNVGAQFYFNETVRSWHADETGVSVRTELGRYHGANLIISAGAWLGQLVPELNSRLRIERQVLHWFDALDHEDLIQPERLPVHLVEYEPGRYFYALPNVGSGLKAALHHQGETTTADEVCRDVSVSEQQAMGDLVHRHLSCLSISPSRSVTCLYTNTPDEHFLIDRHPAHRNVLIVSPCSGHGFKFASAIGDVVARLVLGKPAAFDLSLFSIDRMQSEWRG